MTNVGVGGTSLHSLMETAQELGFICQAVEIDISALTDVQAPAIVCLDNHFVVIDSVGQDTLRIADPALGWRNIPKREFAASWNGVALEFVEGPSELGLKQEHLLRSFVCRLRPYSSKLLLILILNIAAMLFIVSLPIYAGMLGDSLVRHSGHKHAIDGIFTAAVLLSLLAIINLFRQLMANSISGRMQVEIGCALVSHILNLPLGTLQRRSTGDLFGRFEELQQISAFISTEAAEALLDTMLSISALVVLLWSNTRLGMVLCGVALVLLVLGFVVSPLVKRRMTYAFHHHQAAASLFVEAMNHVVAIKSNDAESSFTGKWGTQTQRAVSSAQGALALSALVSTMSLVAYQGYPLAIAAWGIAGSFGFSASQVIGAAGLSSIALSSVVKLSGHYLNAQRSILGISRLHDIFDEKTEEWSRGSEDKTLPRLPASPMISVRNLSISFGDVAVLRDVTFDLPPGEALGIVGPSGSGKSTLALTIAGLLRPTAGTISLNGRNMLEFTREEYRQMISLVPQEPHLLKGSIIDNICLGSEDRDWSRAYDAASSAFADEFIRNGPGGYLRHLGAAGAGLSVGQRQRIAIARALYRRTPIIILDEPTSALDMDTETSITEMLLHLRGRTTVIVIAHRLQTLESVDQLLWLEDGAIRQRGAPQSLKRGGGAYADAVVRHSR